MSFYKAMEAELAALESELADDPRYRKIVRLKAALDEYKADQDLSREIAARARLAATADVPTHHTVAVGRRRITLGNGMKAVPLTKEEQVLAETRKHLEHFRGAGPQHRSSIANHLIQLGILGGEKDPVASLGVYLSRSPDFISDGKGNYSLRTEETVEPELGALAQNGGS